MDADLIPAATKNMATSTFKMTSPKDLVEDHFAQGIITFHNYLSLDKLQEELAVLRAKTDGRPIVCTEWMARVFGSYFDTYLPFFKGRCVRCFNSCLVQGKTQTHPPPGIQRGRRRNTGVVS
jgi:hypothetical protein